MPNKPVISIALHSSALEWMIPQKSGDKVGTPVLHQAELELNPEHPTILDSARNDREALIREITAKCGKLHGPVVLGLPAAWALLRVVELPQGSPAELRGMVDLQVDKFSPFPAETVVVSYELLHEAEGRVRVLIAALQTEIADVLGRALNMAGMQTKWVDINLLAWWRLLADKEQVRHTGSQAFLLLDGPSCDLIVTSAGVPVAIRALSGMETLPPEEMAEEIARETAYTLSSLNLEQGGAEQGVDVGVWHHGDPPHALLRQFRDHFGITAQAHPLSTLPSLAEGLARRALARSEGALDLAPPAWRQAEDQRRMRGQVLAGSAVLLGVWLAGLAVLFGGLQVQKQKLAKLDARLGQLQEPVQNVRTTRERVLALEQYTNRTYSALESLREVSDLLPPGIELKSFAYRKGKAVEIAGEADSVTLVYDFKKELEQSDLFPSNLLHRIVRIGARESFKITASLPGSEAGGKE
jgi:Tfp pilus assembly protein PilN